MRQKTIAGNWKMNTTLEEGIQLLHAIAAQRKDNTAQVIICPPHTHLASFKNLMDNQAYLSLGAQNCADEACGAYTGDISVAMIKPFVDFCIVGHSERRSYHGETNESIKAKIDLLLQDQIQPIFCCGESLEERNNEVHFELVESQIAAALFHLDASAITQIIIAYEPIWAIGTGHTASAAQAQEMHAAIRSLLSKKYSPQIANRISIIYGGSCNASNAMELFAQNDIDGRLIGGASLKAEEFIKIIQAAN